MLGAMITGFCFVHMWIPAAMLVVTRVCLPACDSCVMNVSMFDLVGAAGLNFILFTFVFKLLAME